MTDRHAFRAHPLNGAMLYFQAATGTHVRVQDDSTRALRRQAPRVAMFGITNRCNLRCDFCSRDTGRSSDWTVASASAVLQGLAAAGTLEVAFGGGEPFAFRGFAELVAELHRSTALALNVTTNATLLSDGMFAAYAGRLGQVRVSIYEGSDWRRGCRVLASHGQRWGANLLVDEAALPGLPALLAELAALGCRDVSLLSYVGPDPRRHLSPRGRVRLAELIDDSPLACRLSVCFGDSVPAPRLFDGPDHSGDCGAGLDFVSITPDRRMQACSFQDGGLPASTAQEILQGWRHTRDRLDAASPRRGCARPASGAAGAQPRAGVPPIAVWQAYSGNNSGECIMVAKFHNAQDAEAYLARLLPGWKPDVDTPPEWRRLFAEEGLAVGDPYGDTPGELLAIGRSVMAVGYGLDDMLANLRALAWKQGAYLVPGGVHLHHGPVLLAAVRARDMADARTLARAAPHPSAETFVHGELVLVTVPQGTQQAPASLTETRDLLLPWADGRALAAELLFEPTDRAALIRAKKQLGTEIPRRSRLLLRFWGPDGDTQARRFAQTVNDVPSTVAGSCVLLSGRSRWKRLAVLAYRHGADVQRLEGGTLCLMARLVCPGLAGRSAAGPGRAPIDAATVDSALRNGFPRHHWIDVPQPSRKRDGPIGRISLHSDEPEQALAELGRIASQLGASLGVYISEVDPLAFALRRVVEDVQG